MEQKKTCEPKARGRRPAEGEARPFLYRDLLACFTKRVCHFVTINPYKKGPRFAKLQKIGPVIDILRRYSPDFFIVREYNLDGTSHYHALCLGFDTQKGPPKHVTFHVQRVGDSVRVPVIPETPITNEDRLNWDVIDPVIEELGCHHHLLAVTKALLSYIWNCQRKARNRHNRKIKKERSETHVGRVLDYMLKDNPMIEYEDWARYARKADVLR